MADTNTASEWQAVLEKAKAEQPIAQKAATDAFNKAFQANANLASAQSAVDKEVAANGGKLPFFSSTYSDYKKAAAESSSAAAANEAAQAHLRDVNATISQASESLAIADKAPPTVTSSTPDPASSSPGDPVTVGGPISQSAAPVVQTPLDDGSDPYYSNGKSYYGDTTTETPSTSRTVLSPEDDGVEAARLAAEQRANEAPTEQVVIDASQDSKLSQEEQGQLRDYQASQQAILKAESDNAGNPEGNWTSGSVDQVRTSQTASIQRNTINKADWRVRLSLAPGANYLYNVASHTEILYPLKQTDGVIFPYTPTINTSYKASYDNLELMHSNYKLYFYKNSSVDEFTITADFTAQDTYEANYLLAVIHFFKSVTKMFYGQDTLPKAGTPPPLLYLNGYGAYQFNEHPCLLQSFTYNLPNDVDYVRAGSITQLAGTRVGDSQVSKKDSGFMDNLMSYIRKSASGLKGRVGNISEEPNWVNYANTEATYVPTKLQITLTLIPVVTRNDISKNFSVEKYATGELTRGNKRPTGGGIW